jgi:hypothetical protein
MEFLYEFWDVEVDPTNTIIDPNRKHRTIEEINEIDEYIYQINNGEYVRFESMLEVWNKIPHTQRVIEYVNSFVNNLAIMIMNREQLIIQNLDVFLSTCLTQSTIATIRNMISMKNYNIFDDEFEKTHDIRLLKTGLTGENCRGYYYALLEDKNELLNSLIEQRKSAREIKNIKSFILKISFLLLKADPKHDLHGLPYLNNEIVKYALHLGLDPTELRYLNVRNHSVCKYLIKNSNMYGLGNISIMKDEKMQLCLIKRKMWNAISYFEKYFLYESALQYIISTIKGWKRSSEHPIYRMNNLRVLCNGKIITVEEYMKTSRSIVKN